MSPRRAHAERTGGAIKPKTIIAAGLIALGIAAFAYQVGTYMTGGRDVSVGPSHKTTELTPSVPLLPIFGVIALIGGIAWLLVDKGDFDHEAAPRVGKDPMGIAAPKAYVARRDARPLP